MPHKLRLIMTLALLSCSFIFVQTNTAQEPLSREALADDENDAEEREDDKDENHRVSSKARMAKRATAHEPWLSVWNRTSTLALVTAFESEELVVKGTEVPVEYPALPEVEGTRINSGKKTSFVRPEEFPSIANNDYREALSTTPGLLVSEEPSSPIVNFGYRGLDSQRSEFMQVLKDGVSIKNEQFGFPESHYTPIIDAVEQIEFVRAGAALRFGPQPGGALNFVMKMPNRQLPFEFYTKNLFGTDGLYQNYTSVDGTVGQFGYYAYFDHRQRDGFRTNADYEVNNGSAKLVYDLTNDSRLILTADLYNEEHGEPGGLTEVFTPGASLYQVDRNVTTRFFDRFRLERYYGMLEYQKIFSEQTQLDLKAFGGYLDRFSK